MGGLMKLVLDSNEVFATVITKGKDLQSWALDIFFSRDVELFAPFRLLAELERNREEIRVKSGFTLRDFEAFIEIIKLRVEFLPLEEFLDKIPEAKELAPHLKDVEYFALALKLDCCIWSEEKAFKKQSCIEAFNSMELVERISNNR